MLYQIWSILLDLSAIQTTLLKLLRLLHLSTEQSIARKKESSSHPTPKHQTLVHSSVCLFVPKKKSGIEFVDTVPYSSSTVFSTFYNSVDQAYISLEKLGSLNNEEGDVNSVFLRIQRYNRECTRV